MQPVLSTSAGDWFLPADGGAGSLLRVADGVAPDAVRRIRDLDLPGLLPIGNVVPEKGQVWLRTPQPPGPTLDQALDAPLTGADGVAVLAGVVRVLARLHERGLTHGRVDARTVLLDPDGDPIVVMLDAGEADPAEDAAAAARLARALAAGWCAEDPDRAALLLECADVLEGHGTGRAVDVLPADVEGCAAARRRLVRELAPAVRL
jgi:hypothetical protein